MGIKENVFQMLRELPEGVQLLVAAKGRQPQEVSEAIKAGVRIVGENYVQEAKIARELIGSKAEWHFLGHLQGNKVKKAVGIFDMIETIDSVEIAREIDKRCTQLGKVMPVLIEVNSGRELQKAGMLPENAERLIREISAFRNIKVMGLMTMGSVSRNPEDSRLFFREMKKLFDEIKGLDLPNVEMKYLSMGMSDTYKIAVEEGANIVRIGSKIFGNLR